MVNYLVLCQAQDDRSVGLTVHGLRFTAGREPYTLDRKSQAPNTGHHPLGQLLVPGNYIALRLADQRPLGQPASLGRCP